MKFLETLKNAEKLNKNIVIPDIKCYSPKEGDLMKGRSPVEYAKALCRAGAPVLSVVTEPKEFHGSLEMLRSIADAVNVPVLRKDFIHTVKDLEETVEAGASAILLMCSCLEKDELVMLYHAALELGLDPFVETHVAEDFELVRELSAKLVGINNRDILVLERDNGNVSNTEMLAKLVPEDAFLVSESSIENPDQVRRAIAAGSNAALVGTAILRAEYTESFYKMMCSRTSLKICGLMNEKDVNICVKNGVERIGIVTEYPLYVPWNLTAAQAKEVRSYIPAGHAACMVTGGSPEKIIALAEEVRPDYVQLHYMETIEDVEMIAEALKKLGIGIIKTVPFKEESMMAQFHTTDVEKMIDILNRSSADELLVDPRQGNVVASKNLTADIDFMKKIKELSTKPVILAGGISAENIEEKLQQSKTTGVDIMNGSEDEPGRKSEDKIERIVKSCFNF